MFVAGRIAGERGWTDAAVVTVAQLPVLEPTGAPLVLVADSAEISALAARLIASVESVGRPIMVVCDKPLAPEAAVWLNSELIQSLENEEIPRVIPEDPKATHEPSAHERREQEELAELKKAQKTPSLVPDQAVSDKKEAMNTGEAAKESASGKSEAKSKSSSDKKSEGKPAKQASSGAASGKSHGRSRAESRQSGSSKGKASAEALREFRSLASD